MDEKLKLLYEILEQSQMVEKLIISSEIAMNDGEVNDCQKYTKDAQNMLKVMCQDVFAEYSDMFVSTEEANDYDMPTALELARNISNMCSNIGTMLGLMLENQSQAHIDSCSVKIAKDIRTITEIYQMIYAN